jgi:hypothetical protein
MKNFFSLSGRLLFLVFIVICFLILSSPVSQAQFNPDQFGNLHGFIWTDTIGRISLNCHNDFDGDGIIEAEESRCSAGPYGVTIGNDFSLTGLAWSEAVGLICFGASCRPANPPGPPLGESEKAEAKIDLMGKVSGWAKIKNLEGENGWISLRGINQDGISFGVQINLETGQGSGQAWNRHPDGTGIGWLDFREVKTSFRPSVECQPEGATRLCGSAVGECRPGTQTCQEGKWNECQGAVGPQKEVCGDGKDNDCDGVIDNGCRNVCQVGQTMACQVGGCLGKMICQSGGMWSSCQVVSQPEVCGDHLDNDCNGLVDESCSLPPERGIVFQVFSPQGIYEPLCQNSQGTIINCETKKRLKGTHLHTFEIKIKADKKAVGQEASCLISFNPSQGHFFELKAKVDEKGEARLSYTIKPTDPIDQRVWQIVSCRVNDSRIFINQPIFVHPNSWTEIGEKSDLANALACWRGEMGRYFNNSKPCDFEGDYLFVRSMARGIPVEGICDDELDNDGNGYSDCQDRFCQGISYRCK